MMQIAKAKYTEVDEPQYTENDEPEYTFDLERMKQAVEGQEFVTVPENLTAEEIGHWLRSIAE